MDQYIGKLLDNRYEILELIGVGGMARVYKARCHRLNRLVAVKILRDDLVQDAELRRRFHDESQAVAMLSHPNIVAVYDVSRSSDFEYIVMELIDGITLKQYMQKKGNKLNWREALHFITQIVKALGHAHSRGIIHRDIKPHNIMVLRDGSVKVADFGIARVASGGHSTLTQEALGSVHYISPEQARGDRTDARSDIYSAGVVLYEMLTGRLPFEGESAVSVAIQHLSSVPLAPREIDPDIPEALELICMKAMCANLEKRYPSADAMLEDLEKFRKNNSVDLGYIRADLEEPEDHEPTQAIPTAAIQAARKERTPAEEKKRDKKLIAIVVGGFAAALLVVFLLFKFVFSGINDNPAAQSYKVPDVLGKTVEEAQQMEGIKGVFQIEVAGSKADSNYQPGQIIEQDPKSGHVRKNNLKITVWICAKEETNLMVNVLGEDVQYAKVELTNLNLNLNVQIREVYSDEYAAGKVISSTPAAGESIKKGDSILLTVSKGPETKPVTVQNYAGLSVDDAALQAENAGLTVGAHQYEYDATVPEGSVIRQSLAPKTEVAPGTEIVFTVSKGPEPSQTTEQTVTFDIPGEYLNPELGILNVEIRQDTTVVYSTTVDTTDPAAARSVSHTFTGDKGTSITVYLYINGTEVASQVVSF